MRAIITAVLLLVSSLRVWPVSTGSAEPPSHPAASAAAPAVRSLHLAEQSSLSATGLDHRIGMSEGWRDMPLLRDSQAGADRIVFSWALLEKDGPDSFDPQRYAARFLPSETLAEDVADGREVVGLIQFTPAWAARDPAQGERSVPKGLGDPNGPWSQFVRRLVGYYRGQVSAWMIWNEMDFRPGDVGAGDSWTWGGSEAEYWQLLKDASRAAKSVDPNARIVFGATSYWVDVLNGRELYPERVLTIAARDPETPANDWFFDAIAMNLYRAPDDIYRVSSELERALQRVGVDKPRWVTELNCMPFDDPATPKPDDRQRCTLDEQAAFTVQAFAMALAAGWDRAFWYQLTDNHAWREQEVWGLVRDDDTPRPAYQAYRTVTTYFSHADRITFRPLRRSTQPWGTPWPDDPSSLYPDWLVYQVVVDRGPRRINVLWNGSGRPLRARVPKQGASAMLVDKLGQEQPLEAADGWYTVDLPPATAAGPFDPSGYYYVGGDPYLVVQQGVPADAPIRAPAL